MRIATLVCGVVAALLGALWLLQGLGIVQLAPILCFVDCAPVQEPSATWAVVGAIALCLGLVAIFWSIRQWRSQ